MNQNSTTDTLIAFALVFAAGLLCAKLIKGYCRSKQPPQTRVPYPAPAVPHTDQ